MSDELATAQARTAASEKHMRTLDEQLASKTRTCCALEKAATELVPLQEVVAARAALREQTSALHACEVSARGRQQTRIRTYFACKRLLCMMYAFKVRCFCHVPEYLWYFASFQFTAENGIEACNRA